VFLLVFGNGRLKGPVRPYEGAARFIREQLNESDLVAIMAFNRATPFLSDVEQAARIVEQVQARHDEIAFELRSQYRTRHLRSTWYSSEMQSAIDAALQTEPRHAGARNMPPLLWGTEEHRLNERFWHRWDAEFMFWDKLKVLAGIEYLRRAEGEKHLVCFSAYGLDVPVVFVGEPLGLRLDSADEDARLAQRANGARVAVHFVNTLGTVGGLSEVYMASRNVADLTGGRFTSLETADDALAKVDSASRTSSEGSYRDIEVKVSRRDAVVRYARGYRARADVPTLDPREAATRERLREAAAMDIPLEEIKLDAKAGLSSGAGGERVVRVELRIDASRLTLRESSGRHQGVIDLMILCGNEQRKVVCSLSQQMTLSMDEARYRQAMTSGIPYATTVTVSGTATLVKVLVYDYDADLMGVANVRVR
jgi:hypothetical protein